MIRIMGVLPVWKLNLLVINKLINKLLFTKFLLIKLINIILMVWCFMEKFQENGIVTNSARSTAMVACAEAAKA